MSYRLINANALAANCKQVNDMPCIYADLPNGLDDGYYDLARGNSNKSRWAELFGTPERAARTMEAHMRKCRSADVTLCDNCVMVRSCEEEQALLEWLESEVRDD